MNDDGRSPPGEGTPLRFLRSLLFQIKILTSGTGPCVTASAVWALFWGPLNLLSLQGVTRVYELGRVTAQGSPPPLGALGPSCMVN